jgi:hypothetical protein
VRRWLLVAVMTTAAARGSAKHAPSAASSTPQTLRDALLRQCAAEVAHPAPCVDLVGWLVDIATAKQCLGSGEATTALVDLERGSLTFADVDAIFATCAKPGAPLPPLPPALTTTTTAPPPTTRYTPPPPLPFVPPAPPLPEETSPSSSTEGSTASTEPTETTDTTEPASSSS